MGRGIVMVDSENGEVLHDNRAPGEQQAYEEEANGKPLKGVYCPLFPDSTQFADQSPGSIKVFQKEPLHVAGYKGELEPEATERDIHARWGDGTYELHQLDGTGKATGRKRSGVRISMGAAPGSLGALGRAESSASSATPARDESHERLIHKAFDRADAEVRRSADQHRETISQVREQEKAFVEIVNNNGERTAKQNQDFMAAMIAMLSQGHASTVNMMLHMQKSADQTHQQTLQLMERANQANNPLVFLQLFKEGMQMGQGMDQPDEPMLAGLKMVSETVGNFKDMYSAKMGAMVQQARAPQALPGVPAVKEIANPTTPRVNATKIKELIAECHKRGIDVDSLVDQALSHVTGSGPAPQTPPAPEPEPDTGDDDDEDDEDDFEEDAAAQS